MVLVIVFHFDRSLLPGGFVGVDIFFVLSGYLITGFLLDELGRTGRIDLARFSARRVGRLLPAALVVLAVTAVVTAWMANPLDRALVADDLPAVAFGWSNWRFMAAGADYFAPVRGIDPFNSFWSLAVEEQFYLVWPSLMWAGWALLRRARLEPRRTGAGVIAVAVAVGFWWWVRTGGTDPVGAYYATWFRGAQLGAGALLAWLMPSGRGAAADPGRRSTRIPRAVVPIASLVGVLGTAVAVAAYEQGDPYPGHTGVLVTGAAVALVFAVDTDVRGRLARWLSRVPLIWLGQRSYGLYLWHLPVHELGPGIAARSGITLLDSFVWQVALTVALSALSFTYVEQPVRRWAAGHRPRVVIAAGLGTLVAGVVCLGLVMAAPWSTLVGGLTVDEVTAAATDRPVTYDTGCHGGRENGWIGDVCERRAAPGRPTVALLGDSHAASWDAAMLAIAERDDLGYRYATYSACPPIDLTGWDRSQAKACRSFAETVVPALGKLGPGDTIVVAFDWFDLLGKTDTVADDAPVTSLVTEALRVTTAELSASGASVVYLGPIPRLGASGPECLAAAKSSADCWYDNAPTSETELLAASALAPLIDEGLTSIVPLDDLVCPGRRCSALVDGTITYRDRQHLTQSYTARLAGPLAAELGFEPFDVGPPTSPGVQAGVGARSR